MKQTFRPYYAVIFTSTQNENIEGYSEMANKMEHLAKQQKGFLGIDSARNEVGITVSYWETRGHQTLETTKRAFGSATKRKSRLVQLVQCENLYS